MKHKLPVKTKERIEFENFVKDARVLDLKARMSEQGIDLSKVSRQQLDEIIRLVVKETDLSREMQEKQQETQAEIQKINAEIKETIAQGEAIIDSIKKEQNIGVTKGEPQKENLPESQ